MDELKILEACFYVSFLEEIRLKIKIEMSDGKIEFLIFNNSNSIKIFNQFNTNVTKANQIIGKQLSIEFLQSLLKNNKNCSPPLFINE